MFKFAISFNQPIGDWDVSRVTNMKEMFYYAKKFNQPIGKWIVSNVTNMEGMFEGAVSFNQPIGNWDVSRVTNMVYMFEGADSFNQPIDNWNYQQNTATRSDTNSYVNASDASRYTGSNTDWENYGYNNRDDNNEYQRNDNEYERNEYERNYNEYQKRDLIKINKKIAELFLNDNPNTDYHLLTKLKETISNGRDVSSFLNVVEVNYDTNNTHTNGNRNYFINDTHLFELNGLRQSSNFALGLITEDIKSYDDYDEDDENYVELYYLINPATKKIPKKIPNTDAEHIFIHDLSEKQKVIDSLDACYDFYFKSNNQLTMMRQHNSLEYYSYDNRYPFIILGSYYNQEENVIEYLTADAHNFYFACKVKTDEEWRDYYNENIVKKIIDVEGDKEGTISSIEPNDPIQTFHYIKIKYNEKYDENNQKVYKLYDIDITWKHKDSSITSSYRILDGQLGMITIAENMPQSGETAPPAVNGESNRSETSEENSGSENNYSNNESNSLSNISPTSANSPNVPSPPSSNETNWDYQPNSEENSEEIFGGKNKKNNKNNNNKNKNNKKKITKRKRSKSKSNTNRKRRVTRRKKTKSRSNKKK
jgi:surface protein